MRKRIIRTLVIMAGISGVFGISQGLAYVGETIAMYQHAAPCGVQTGLVGLLQATHFIPTGGCKTYSDGSCQDSQACTISNPPSGGATKGNCTTVISGSAKSCICLAK